MVDFGSGEIGFYPLNYPKAIGVDWDVAKIISFKKFPPKRILYLSATNETLLERKAGDF